MAADSSLARRPTPAENCEQESIRCPNGQATSPATWDGCRQRGRHVPTGWYGPSESLPEDVTVPPQDAVSGSSTQLHLSIAHKGDFGKCEMRYPGATRNENPSYFPTQYSASLDLSSIRSPTTAGLALNTLLSSGGTCETSSYSGLAATTYTPLWRLT